MVMTGRDVDSLGRDHDLFLHCIDEDHGYLYIAWGVICGYMLFFLCISYYSYDISIALSMICIDLFTGILHGIQGCTAG